MSYTMDMLSLINRYRRNTSFLPKMSQAKVDTEQHTPYNPDVYGSAHRQSTRGKCGVAEPSSGGKFEETFAGGIAAG